ncbi:hypothetical protein FQN49_007973, partial [Arthroderma sp. PD_2]
MASLKLSGIGPPDLIESYTSPIMSEKALVDGLLSLLNDGGIRYLKSKIDGEVDLDSTNHTYVDDEDADAGIDPEDISGPHPAVEEISWEVIKHNDQSLEPLPANVLDLDILLPELESKSPAERLDYFKKRFEKDPVVENSLLLQVAVNQIVNIGEVDREMLKKIEDSTSVLHHKDDNAPKDSV